MDEAIPVEYVFEGKAKARRRAVRINCLECGISSLRRADKDGKRLAFCSIHCHNKYQSRTRYKDGQKLCGSCGTYKNLDDFHRKSETGKPRATCIDCTEERRRSRGRPEMTIAQWGKVRLSIISIF